MNTKTAEDNGSSGSRLRKANTASSGRKRLAWNKAQGCRFWGSEDDVQAVKGGGGGGWTELGQSSKKNCSGQQQCIQDTCDLLPKRSML